MAASKRLRESAASLAPLADTGSGITRDVGSIAIIEHDGSNYDRTDATGQGNYAPRAAVAQRFYQTHADLYDFLVVFTNFDFNTGDAVAFHALIRNDVRGIGKPIVDNGALFGSPGRLQGYVDMAAINQYRAGAFRVEPGTIGFAATIGVMAHEIGHQWLAQPRFLDDSGQVSSALLGKDAAHWSFLLDSDASLMYGSEWTPDGSGMFEATRVRDGYSALDLYLMGFLGPERVGPITLLRNPAVDATALPVEGSRVSATPATVLIGQIVAAEGERRPNHGASPKTFRVGFVFLAAPGTEPSADDLAAVDRFRTAFASHFFALTRGVALADTTLAEAPTVPHAGAPDLAKALAWLLSRQGTDGSWQDSSFTGIRDTAASLEALTISGQSGPSYQKAVQWTLAAEPPNLDFAARRASALALKPAPSPDLRTLVQALLARQNPDGGFGVASGYESDPLDTALVLRALSGLGQPVGPSVRRALVALAAMKAPSGGWPSSRGGDLSAVATAHVLLALQDWSAAAEAQAQLAAGLAALLSLRNGDGGFGESPSTPYATALSLQVLLRTGSSADVVNGAIAWLQASQMLDGSWEESSYQTALVLGALKGGTDPNLVVPADSLVLDPASAREGQTVHITARIRNMGRTAAAPSHARLYDGDPASGVIVAEAAVPALGPGEESEVSFDLSTTDRAGDRTVFVVADAAGEVTETREDDNSTSRALHVEGLLADLVVGGLVVSPNPPEDGETVQVAVVVRNAGERAAAPSVLGLFDGNPRTGGRLIGQADVGQLDPGQAVTATLPWNTTGSQGAHLLFALADMQFSVYESNELDNEASLPVEVTGPQPPGPDLALAGLALSPAALSTIPQAIEARVLVRNLGRDAAASSVALYDSNPASPPLARQVVSVGARSETIVTLTGTVASPGTRTLIAVADPDGTLPETNETNNQATAILQDPANTFDLEVRPADVSVSAADVVLGAPITVTAMVRNRGTASVASIPVILARVAGTSLDELARVEVSLAAGAITTVTLPWTASITGDPVPLAVVVDPFDLVFELTESNNRANLSVRVRPSALPNLSVSGATVAFEPDPPLEGGAALVSALVRNPSPIAAGPFLVRFYRGDPATGGTLIGETSLDGLAAASSAVASVTWSPVDARGAQGVFVLADPSGQVEEYDEADNQAFRPFAVIGLPDLVLAVADVTLVPGYPRSGEPVTVRATVRNLGGQAAPGSLLQAFEGEPLTGAPIGEVSVPPLAPGQAATLELPWTPGSPPGEKTLSLLVDPDGAVREQDEGNNLARRSVVVQDADLYLTEPYFSPDGDGVKDETTLAYRATVPVTIVVSNSRGQKVRSLAQAAPASGTVAWDGRDDKGRLMWDGRYTLSLEGEAGVVLGRAEVVLDTNRSPIHDSAGTRLTAVRNLTCALPDVVGPAWLPGEDEALFIVDHDQPGFLAGLLRVSLDGSYSYIVQDPWFQQARFASASSWFAIPSARDVSPDGHEVLVVKDWDLSVVDLVTGEHRSLSAPAWSGATWSPDGRWISTASQILSRDGSVVAQPQSSLPFSWSLWAWSPDGEFLAQGNSIVRRDGSELRTIPLPEHLYDDQYVVNTAIDTIWRGDGKIYASVAYCGDGCASVYAFLIDPESGAATQLTWLGGKNDVSWSPDGSKALYQEYHQYQAATTLVAREDGSLPLQLIDWPAYGTPRGTAAYFGSSEQAQPGQACYGQGTSDVFAMTTLQNLTAQLSAIRLPANNGILLRGTVSDKYLDHYQLEYAEQAQPAVWHPIGAASDVPVIDDVLGVFAPATPGTYALRLTAVDRAGNVRSRTRVLAWDRVPSLANITQTEFLISPNGDGRKDSVTFNYLVIEPTRVEVRITGPEQPGVPAPTVRQLSLEYPTVPPGPSDPASFFTWDGRDDQGALVPDGRYTVLINDMPFRVDVDATPPDIAWAWQNLRTEQAPQRCGKEYVPSGVFLADRLWHAVDPHLKSWNAPGAAGTAQVYEPERDASGAIIYDAGVPRIKVIDGRPVDLVERQESPYTVNLPDATFAAGDYAGNESTVTITPVVERLFILDAAVGQCHRVLLPPIAPGSTTALKLQTTFRLAQTLLGSSAIRFQYRGIAGPWSEVPTPMAGQGRGSHPLLIWTADFQALGLPLGQVLEGRFVAAGQAGDIYSESFRFKLCDDFLALHVQQKLAPAGDGPIEYHIRIDTVVPEPLLKAQVLVKGFGSLDGFEMRVSLDQPNPATFTKTVVLPRTSCERNAILSFIGVVAGQSGRVYRDDRACALLVVALPDCPHSLQIEQEFPYCGGSPDLAFLWVTGSSAEKSTLTVTRGPGDPPQVIEQAATEGLIDKHLVTDVTGLAQGDIPAHASLAIAGGQVVASAATVIAIDRTPATVDILQPAEGEQLCTSVNPQTGRGEVRLVAKVVDAGTKAEFSGGELQLENGPWMPLALACQRDDATGFSHCGNLHSKEPIHEDFPRILTGLAAPIFWDVTGLASGNYTLRLTFCDRAGNKTTVLRGVSLRNESPNIRLVRPPSPVFSPNGDGRMDVGEVTIGIYQALRLTVEVRQGDSLVRSLAADQPFLPGNATFLWDGRNAAGQVVPDGTYAFVFAGSDACGRGGSLQVVVDVDNTAPSATISVPVAGESLGASVGIRGTATDVHFLSYAVSAGAGADPTEWVLVASSSTVVDGAGGLLGQWNTPRTEGVHTLRLQVNDRAGNTSEVRTPVTIRPRIFLDLFSVTPDIFSPNGDGRRETATVAYRLVADGKVTLAVRSGGVQGPLIRTFESDVLRTAGQLYQFPWDGTSDPGLPMEDGEYAVWIRVEDPSGSGSPQEEFLTVVLDRAPPAVTVQVPASGGFTNRDRAVLGSITDAHFGTYAITAAQGLDSLELARGGQPPAGQRLADLAPLADGPHTLSVFAEDRADNRTQVDVPFTIDSIPPVVRLEDPAPGAVLDRGTQPIPIRGTATDDHLAEYRLSYGLGVLPAYFLDIARGTTGGSGILLGSWAVASIPDGVYTLSLTAADKAANPSRDERRTLTLDSVPPVARITSPADGDWVNSVRPVVGTASDANLRSWRLESAPGAAVQWSVLGTGASEVQAGALSDLAPLPPDGVHTLRLTVEDRAGHVSSALSTVTIDTVPPASPQGLAAEVVRPGGPLADVRLTWQPNTEADLAGYRVFRADEALTPGAPLGSPTHVDAGRPEGTYSYAVVALDRAGNASLPAQINVRVDLTPPLAEILYPASGAALSGSVDVRGTVFAPDDLKEYRLFVGVGENPSTWTLLHRSTLGATAGVLGTWTAAGDGPYVLALEAEDTSGNQARVTVPVQVDNHGPNPPVLTSVSVAPAPDALTSTWDPSSSSDVAGYVVYRNGRIANAPGIVLDDPRAFRVPGPSYVDAALPDGQHCYRIVALDQAGNLSAPSNEICRTLDNRAPHATISEPASGSRFEFPVRVTASTPDIDIAAVRFQVKPHAGASWADIAAPDTAEPYEATLDPATLSGFGQYDLRAIATDQGGRTDPAPSVVVVVYGDTTPPEAPRDLVAHVDGALVKLTWTANAESDLAGYHVARDGAALATTTDAAFDDPSPAAGNHVYAVTAVDHAGNESSPTSADALVYSLRLAAPAFPVTRDARATLSGEGAVAGTTAEILRAGAVVESSPATAEAFRVPDVPLEVGANWLSARGVDAKGNRSIRSDEILLISNPAPSAVAGLTSLVSDHRVSLSWDPVPDADLYGYLVHRDGALLTTSSLQTTAASIVASAPSGSEPPWAFDGDPGSVWVPYEWGVPTSWSVTFATSVLVDRVTLHFASPDEGPMAIADYRIEARWQDQFIPLAVVHGNTDSDPTHLWPTPFATDALRVVILRDTFTGLSEVEVSKIDAVPAGTTSFQDDGAADGVRTYTVLAIDQYGAEGEPASTSASVGDVLPPGAPTGLIATAAFHDVLLSWDPNPEPDVVRYVLFRDNVRIATTSSTGYRDVGLAAGSYTYTVLAVDAVGHEGPESAPALATVSALALPPPVPLITFPTDAAHPIAVASPLTDVRGLAQPGSLVSLEVNGVLSAIAVASAGAPAFVETGSAPIVDPAGVATISSDGKTLAYAGEDAGGAVHTTLVDAATGAARELTHPGYEEVSFGAFSPDGEKLIYVAGTFSDPAAIRDGLFFVDLSTDARTTIEEGPDTEGDAAWSPDGSRIVFATSNATEARLFVRDLGALTSTPVASVPAPATMSFLSWSPDGARLAFILTAGDAGPYELRVLDVATGAQSTLDAAVWPWAPLAWSADGSRLAYTAAGPKVVIRDLAAGLSTDVTDGTTEAFGPRFDPTGGLLSFVRTAPDAQGTGLRTFVVRDLGTSDEAAVGVPLPEDQPHALVLHEWLADGRLALSLGDRIGFFEGGTGAFELKDVALSAGDNTLVARATDLASGLTGPDSRPVRVTVNGAAFPDLTVSPDDLGAYPEVPLVGRTATVSARVANLGSVVAPDVAVVLTLLQPTGTTVFEHRETLAGIEAGQNVLVSVPWTPTAEGTYLLKAQVDPGDTIVEGRENNNDASRALFVALSGDLAAAVEAGAAYPAHTPALVQVTLNNAGSFFEGSVRTTVEDGAGQEVAVADSRSVSLGYGASLSFSALWNTGTTYAGNYALHVRATDATGTLRAQAIWAFAVLPDVSVGARLIPARSSVAAGQTASFAARVENRGANVPLGSLTARLRVLPEGASAPAFTADASLPLLLPGGLWEGVLAWPTATPAGSYLAELSILKADGSVLTTTQAAFRVTGSAASLSGSLRLVPADILAGGTTEARVAITNQGIESLAGETLAVEVTAGADPTPLVRQTVTLDLAPGETRETAVSLATGALAVGFYPAFLRTPTSTLDRTPLRVHGLITPPSVDSPPDGSTVDTSHPRLCVNDASVQGGAALTYEFQVFADPALQQPLPGVIGFPEGPGRTCWRVVTNLAEDRTFYWRARAEDGFSSSAYTSVVSFKVDALNEAPSAPVPQTPRPDARVASNPPTLVVIDAQDPEFDPLTYEFQLATDGGMTQVVTSAAGVPEGSVVTSWPVPVVLEEDATYYWSARANDGRALSPWSPPIAFTVDVTDASPTAPTPLRPVGGVQVPTLTPELAVGNATDPESQPLSYVFQVDRVPSFDSSALEVSPAIPGGVGEIVWTPATPLADNTLHYWRAAASDGSTFSPWAGDSFFVNLGNDPPSVPVPLDPADGQVVTTLTPTLRVRDALDPDRDALTYDFSVTDQAGTVVASASAVPEASVETSWTVGPPLTEDQSYRWSARAYDGTVAGNWSAPSSFRVNAVQEPPTSPTIVAPTEGQVLGTRQVALVVGNATSPDGLGLTYAFELYGVAADGTLTLVEGTTGLPEGSGTTSWAATATLADGSYAWRARASDSTQSGPWTPTTHFKVQVDMPPAAPTGLAAVPGDARVTLTWNASPEPDVVGYRVYRGAASGGPYDLAGTSTSPTFTDTGLANGITVYYVVTTVDAALESVHSAEVAATPFVAPTHVVAEIRFFPAAIAGECLVSSHEDHERHDHGSTRVRIGLQTLDGHNDCEEDDDCPRWLDAAIELPAGLDPSAIDPSVVRLAGSVAPDAAYGMLVDTDGDGLWEKKVRFRFSKVAPFLVPGSNRLTVTGAAGAVGFGGASVVEVAALRVDLWVTPRTLQGRSRGSDVQARLTFHGHLAARQVPMASLRLNDSVAVRRVVSAHEETLIVKFDRAAVLTALPVGDRVEVRVKGTVRGLPFTATDFIRVIE